MARGAGTLTCFRLRQYKSLGVRITSRIGFADPEAIANQGLVRFFLYPNRRTDLRLEDDRVVVPEINDFACGVFTEEIALARVVGLPRFLNVVGDGAAPLASAYGSLLTGQRCFFGGAGFSLGSEQQSLMTDLSLISVALSMTDRYSGLRLPLVRHIVLDRGFFRWVIYPRNAAAPISRFDRANYDITVV